MKYPLTTVVTLLLSLSIANGGMLQASELEAESVWLPEVEELYHSDVEMPSWLNAPSELVVVRGLAGEGEQSAESVAIHKVVFPRLMEKNGQKWTKWEHSIAEREMRHWLENSNVIVNRFEQPFFKTVDDQQYAAFTREALLLDLSEQNMAALQRRTRNAIFGTRRHWRSTIGIAVGIVGSLLFACWFAFTVLDRITRGYYIGWLRLAAATTFLVSTGLAIHVMRIILRAL